MTINGSAYGLSFQGLAVYVIGNPEEGTGSHQEDFSLDRPSRELKEVTDHILAQLSKLGGVTQITTDGVFPVIYRVSEPDGSSWEICLPVQEPVRKFDDLYAFALP